MRADVAIAGASFAGLGLACHLRDSGLDVLLLDRKAIGERRASACGTPAYIADELAPASVLHRVGFFHIESGGLKRTVKLPEEYCVMDYRRFCSALFLRSNARFMKANVSGASEGGIVTSAGRVDADFIADCTGWSRALSRKRAPGQGRTFVGMEITAPVKEKYGQSLNFFIDKATIPGYAWIFPIGGGLAHVGIGGFCASTPLNSAFRRFLGKEGIGFTENGLTGGVIPCSGLGSPVEGDIFFVGDSARQALPLSGEGIRTALSFSKACASAIGKVAGGELSLQEGLRLYERTVRRSSKGFKALELIQRGFLSLPQPIFDLLVFATTVRPMDGIAARSYRSIARY